MLSTYVSPWVLAKQSAPPNQQSSFGLRIKSLTHIRVAFTAAAVAAWIEHACMKEGHNDGALASLAASIQFPLLSKENSDDSSKEKAQALAIDSNAQGLNSSAHWPRRSQSSQCQPTRGPSLDPHFLDRLRPCGELASVCTDIPLVEANRDYPGGGVGAVLPGQDYLVQFDIGLHHAVAQDVLGKDFRHINSCVGCPNFVEQCFEVVVTGGDHWGNLGNQSMGLDPHAYDCMGGCGAGCKTPGRRQEDIGALDCLKHDVCSAWKSVKTGRASAGFCHDPDCGDEAAMTLFNCWKGLRLFGSVGSHGAGPFSRPAICNLDDHQIQGSWNHAGWFTRGRCKIYQGWKKGQGIPDPHPLRSPIQRL